MRHIRLPALLALLAVAWALAPAAGAAAKPRAYTVLVGQSFAASGQTGRAAGKAARATGVVVVRGRWAGGKWRVVATTKTDATGHYRFKVKPNRPGTLTLRVSPPDHTALQLILHVR